VIRVRGGSRLQAIAAGALATALLAAGTPSLAADAVFHWGDLDLHYDPTLWEGRPADDGTGGVLTCIAPECANQRRPDEPPASVFASSASYSEDGPKCEPLPDSHVGVPIDWPEGLAKRKGLKFLLQSRWSGCRALDAPILEACTEHDGVVYTLSTNVDWGCNFDPPPPIAWFVALTDDVAPRAAVEGMKPQ
jgi:hypothetical protein